MLGGLGFENAYALAMPRERAEALGISSIADLARTRRELAIAGDYEFFERPEWKAMREAYGLHFRAQRQMQPDFMYQAAAAGEVDVMSAYTSDGQIANTISWCSTIPSTPSRLTTRSCCCHRARADDEMLIAALKPLIGAIDVELMREANLRASDGDTSPARWRGGCGRRD